jgi:hypothetical protein
VRTSSSSFEIRLDPGTLRFAHGDGDPAPRIVGYELAVTDRERILDRARARSLPVTNGAVTIAGTRLCFARHGA